METPHPLLRWMFGAGVVLALFFANEATAQPRQRLAGADEAYARDAASYAAHFGIAPRLAATRLRALQESAVATDAIRRRYAERFAGASIDHVPELRINILLTGDGVVPATSIAVAGIAIPVHFRTGARASADDVSRAILQRGAAIHALVPLARGMGLDGRTGELVILIGNGDAARPDLASLRDSLEVAAGVPVRLDHAQEVENQALAGGARVEGAAGDRRFVCTTGFAVTDGVRSALATAAHCPDSLEYQDPEGGRIALAFEGQWGARTQDVQINVAPVEASAAFYADRRSGDLRALGGLRSRLSTRAGEWLCHYGESSGYSCSQVDLINFAPPAPLCAGPCAPTWVSVRTRDCHKGDSGGPVFVGDIAFGITKGGSGAGGAQCNFYFYMSTDFLPAGWNVLLSPAKSP